MSTSRFQRYCACRISRSRDIPLTWTHTVQDYEPPEPDHCLYVDDPMSFDYASLGKFFNVRNRDYFHRRRCSSTRPSTTTARASSGWCCRSAWCPRASCSCGRTRRTSPRFWMCSRRRTSFTWRTWCGCRPTTRIQP